MWRHTDTNKILLYIQQHITINHGLLVWVLAKKKACKWQMYCRWGPVKLRGPGERRRWSFCQTADITDQETLENLRWFLYRDQVHKKGTAEDVLFVLRRNLGLQEVLTHFYSATFQSILCIAGLVLPQKWKKAGCRENRWDRFALWPGFISVQAQEKATELCLPTQDTN